MRNDFPLLNKTTYLDSAAGYLKPNQVIEEISKFYREYPINPHSMDSGLGVQVYKKINEARELVSGLVEAFPEEVIFTSGTTDSLNKAALMFESFMKPGDKIIVSKYNHSSNSVPWIKLANRTNSEVIFSEDLISDIDEKTKIVAYAQMNNTLLQEINHDELFEKVRSVGAILVNDAAQAVTYEKVSLETCDVIAFSGNKIFGPTGIGALVIKKQLLDLLEPVISGGGSIVKYDEKNIINKDNIKKFEPGTINTAGVIGFGEAIKYFNNNKDIEHKNELARYAYTELSKMENVEIISKENAQIILFKIKGTPSQDVVSYLGHKNIILRAGRHCALYLFDSLKIDDTIRLSFGEYNNKDDIDKLIKELKDGGDFIGGF